MTVISTQIKFTKKLIVDKALSSACCLLLFIFLSSCGGCNPGKKATSSGNISTSAKLKMVNSGQPGDNTYDLIRRLSTGVLNYKPDLVIIMIGTNDVITPVKRIASIHYAENIDKIAATIKQQGIQVLLVSPPPIGKQNTGDTVFFNARIDTLNTILRSASIKNSCLYFDMNKAFRDQGTPNSTAGNLLINFANSIHDDGIHPTKNGYSFIGNALYNYLKANGINYKTIVCFGDSITYGAGTADLGTVTGDNYPAVLFRSLSN